MAHHEGEPPAIGHVLEVLTGHGLGAMAQAMETLMNEAIRLQRPAFLGAAPGERSSERIGHTNGFKDKTVQSRVGELALGGFPGSTVARCGSDSRII